MAVLGKAKVADGEFKTIECAIMDLADDIAYSTYDIRTPSSGAWPRRTHSRRVS